MLHAMPPLSPAERLDAALTALVEQRQPLADGALVEVAALVHAALPPVPPGLQFERRVAERLWAPSAVEQLRRRAAMARRELTVGRLIAAGALSSAAVGVTALAVWAGGRRIAGGHR